MRKHESLSLERPLSMLLKLDRVGLGLISDSSCLRGCRFIQSFGVCVDFISSVHEARVALRALTLAAIFCGSRLKGELLS